MSKLEELAKMGTYLVEFLDEFHAHACYIDPHIASRLWRIWDSAREIIKEINERIEEDQIHEHSIHLDDCRASKFLY